MINNYYWLAVGILLAAEFVILARRAWRGGPDLEAL
jgi:hypothetical protein